MLFVVGLPWKKEDYGSVNRRQQSPIRGMQYQFDAVDKGELGLQFVKLMRNLCA